MPENKKKKTANYTPDQLEQLSGSYKHSDNTMAIDENETKSEEKGDGVSSKRPQ